MDLNPSLTPSLARDVENRFAAERRRTVVGRSEVLATIGAYLESADHRPLLVSGLSGSGKSTVMAKAAHDYRVRGRVIQRYIGLSPDASVGSALISSLCLELGPGSVPSDYIALEHAFRCRLEEVAAREKVILFIDALDQLPRGDAAALLNWVPRELPANARLVISTTTVTEEMSGWPSTKLAPLTLEDAGQALEAWLDEAHRTLQPWQRAAVLDGFQQCPLPLYLKLAAEEARLWKSFNALEQCVLGTGIDGVVETMFDRLASNSNYGATLVARALGYLAAARDGLTESELVDLLSRDHDVWRDFDEQKRYDLNRRRLPAAVWFTSDARSRSCTLTSRDGPGGLVRGFFHTQLADRATHKFLAGADGVARHRHVAAYFSNQPPWRSTARFIPSVRRCRELIFQQCAASQWADAERTLTESRFMMSKCYAWMIPDLMEDYEKLLRNAPRHALEDPNALSLIHGALRLSGHVLASRPLQFTSQITDRLAAHGQAPAISNLLKQIAADALVPWLRTVQPALTPAGTELEHTTNIDHVAALLISAEGTRVLAASRTDSVWVLDLASWNILDVWKAISEVQAVAATPGRKRAVFSSAGGAMAVWDLIERRQLATLLGHEATVHSVAISDDGRHVISGSWDKTVRLWNGDTGQLLHTFDAHTDEVDAVAITGDGTRAVRLVQGVVKCGTSNIAASSIRSRLACRFASVESPSVRMARSSCLHPCVLPSSWTSGISKQDACAAGSKDTPASLEPSSGVLMVRESSRVLGTIRSKYGILAADAPCKRCKGTRQTYRRSP